MKTAQKIGIDETPHLHTLMMIVNDDHVIGLLIRQGGREVNAATNADAGTKTGY